MTETDFDQTAPIVRRTPGEVHAYLQGFRAGAGAAVGVLHRQGYPHTQTVADELEARAVLAQEVAEDLAP